MLYALQQSFDGVEHTVYISLRIYTVNSYMKIRNLNIVIQYEHSMVMKENN